MPTAHAHHRWYWLLVIPVIGALATPVYNSRTPEVIGIPFFYWSQLVWVFVSVAITVLVYRRTRGARA
jgi:Protein of unknown function (DUF3311)